MAGVWAEAVYGGKALGPTVLAMPNHGYAIPWEKRLTSGIVYHQ